MNSPIQAETQKPTLPLAQVASAPRDHYDVLLVDDNLADAAEIRHALARSTQADFSVTHVARLESAVAALKRNRFDVVLLDLYLPDSSGYITVAELRRHAPHVPLVVLSAVDNELFASELMEGGAQEFIVKSQLGGTTLSRTIRSAIGRSRSTRDLRLIAKAGTAFMSTLDPEEILRQVTNLPLQGFADMCVVDITSDEGIISRQMAASPELEDQAQSIEELMGTGDAQRMPRLLARTLGTGSSELFEVLTPGILEMLTNVEEPSGLDSEVRKEILSTLSLKSALVVPLLGETEIIGSMMLFVAEPSRCYVRTDLELARKLAWLAAQAITNARLYQGARENIDAGEERLAAIAHDLRTPMTAVKAGVGLLGMRAESRLDSDEIALLENVRRNVSRLADMVSDLLAENSRENGI